MKMFSLPQVNKLSHNPNPGNCFIAPPMTELPRVFAQHPVGARVAFELRPGRVQNQGGTWGWFGTEFKMAHMKYINICVYIYIYK